jgi:hypothetical protein
MYLVCGYILVFIVIFSTQLFDQNILYFLIYFHFHQLWWQRRSRLKWELGFKTSINLYWTRPSVCGWVFLNFGKHVAWLFVFKSWASNSTVQIQSVSAQGLTRISHKKKKKKKNGFIHWEIAHKLFFLCTSFPIFFNWVYSNVRIFNFF